ncbi:uncharacterized protein H6S33_006957 [Morchella sextelata]|uniref:uncharacterized protein n=1 Tax=Morchella sextelata TaxID=1174677 RepID=UPI001D044826|nr:uncharacterized protein H6S33_006957 [Morchella sextelata]KAH0604580.1 hypothetical protein H6S33_006957 [Morchella sextelata]
MRRHNVKLDFTSNSILFDSLRSLRQCKYEPVPAYVQGVSSPLPATHYLEVESISAATFYEITKYLEVFAAFEEGAKQLPQHRPYDHRIRLREVTEPPFGALYSVSRDELTTLKDHLDTEVTSGRMDPSSSPAGTTVLFINKLGGRLRFCLNYRGVNEITIKDQYPLPLSKETFNQISAAKCYPKRNLRAAYNQIRIVCGGEWKRAFRTRNDLESHKDHVNQVLQVLTNNDLYCAPENCEFYVQDTKYLGLIIMTKGLEMDRKMVKKIRDWKAPRNVKNIQGYTEILLPITALIHDNTPFI